MQKEINKLILIMFLLAIAVIIAGLLTSDYERPTNRWTQAKPISFPEEIYLAEPGDTLIVEKVSDSIYIRYR
jgi:hypothetical protein